MFDVKAPLEQVWKALIDIEQVAPCLPGAEVTGREDDGSYKGTFKVKLGPTTAAYSGTLKIDEVDEAAHRAALPARDREARPGGAKATMVNTLQRADGGTSVDAYRFHAHRPPGPVGRGGMIQDISNRMLRDFAACLAAGSSPGRWSRRRGWGPAPRPIPADDAEAPPPAAEAARPSTPPPGAAPASPPAAAPVKGLSLFFSVLWGRIKNLFRRG